jgi:hypothetical protein
MRSTIPPLLGEADHDRFLAQIARAMIATGVALAVIVCLYLGG